MQVQEHARERGVSDATLDYYAQTYGTLGDWISSSNGVLESALHAQIREVESCLDETERTILELHGRRGLGQVKVARLLGKSQSTVCERYATLLERVRYWLLLDRWSVEIAQGLSDLKVESEIAEVIIDYLNGKSIKDAGQGRPYSTTWDIIDDVYQAASRSKSKRAKRVQYMIEARRGVKLA